MMYISMLSYVQVLEYNLCACNVPVRVLVSFSRFEKIIKINKIKARLSVWGLVLVWHRNNVTPASPNSLTFISVTLRHRGQCAEDAGPLKRCLKLSTHFAPSPPHTHTHTWLHLRIDAPLQFASAVACRTNPLRLGAES